MVNQYQYCHLIGQSVLILFSDWSINGFLIGHLKLMLSSHWSITFNTVFWLVRSPLDQWSQLRSVQFIVRGWRRSKVTWRSTRRSDWGGDLLTPCLGQQEIKIQILINQQEEEDKTNSIVIIITPTNLFETHLNQFTQQYRFLVDFIVLVGTFYLSFILTCRDKSWNKLQPTKRKTFDIAL